MVSQIKKVERKKPGPKPTGKGTPIMLRLLPDLLSAVDKHQASIDAPSRPEAIRQILTEYLKRKGISK